jgi:TusA-related sulfurtransferase
MMAEEALSKITEGILEVIVDNEASADNLAWFAKNSAFFSETIRVQIPEQVDQSFRSKSSTRSDANRPLIPEQVIHF